MVDFFFILSAVCTAATRLSVNFGSTAIGSGTLLTKGRLPTLATERSTVLYQIREIDRREFATAVQDALIVTVGGVAAIANAAVAYNATTRKFTTSPSPVKQAHYA